MATENIYRKKTNLPLALYGTAYGVQSLANWATAFQDPKLIPRPDLKYPNLVAPTVEPNTRAFDQGMKNIKEETSGHRRAISEMGASEMLPALFVNSENALNDLSAQKSVYLTEVDSRNAVAEADTANKQSASNAEIFNQGTLAQLNMQTMENQLVAESNAMALTGANASLAQMANAVGQQQQGVMDLIMLDKMLNSYNV